jgi:hypothetical protein
VVHSTRLTSFSSGVGPGNHQPRSNDRGRARDRAICPAGSRSSFTVRRGSRELLIRSGESGASAMMFSIRAETLSLRGAA